jgi:hypothetical protein
MTVDLDIHERTARGVWMAAQVDGDLPAGVIESIWADAAGAIRSYTLWQLVVMGEMSVRWDAGDGKCRFMTITNKDEIARRKAAIREAMNWRAPK